MPQYAYAVLIGRFQPFHLGHMALYNHAQKIAEHVIVIVGSHRVPRSIRNPWTSEEREGFIRKALSDRKPESYTIIHVHDSAYNFNNWLTRIKYEVSKIAGQGTVAIVGHFKDDSSYYLNYFPEWHLETVEEQASGISSTEIRRAYFEGHHEVIQKHIAPAECDALLRWVDDPQYPVLCDEYAFIKNYRKRWESAPFPPTFVTADAVVFALGNVLLIQRKLNPGKGRYALPGGFVNVDESIENACMRELHEETGLDIAHAALKGSIRMNNVFDHPMRDPRGRMITHAYMFELSTKTLPACKAGDDAAKVFWYPLHLIEDTEELFFNDHAQIIKFFMNRMK